MSHHVARLMVFHHFTTNLRCQAAASLDVSLPSRSTVDARLRTSRRFPVPRPTGNKLLTAVRSTCCHCAHEPQVRSLSQEPLTALPAITHLFQAWSEMDMDCVPPARSHEDTPCDPHRPQRIRPERRKRRIILLALKFESHPPVGPSVKTLKTPFPTSVTLCALPHPHKLLAGGPRQLQGAPRGNVARQLSDAVERKRKGCEGKCAAGAGKPSELSQKNFWKDGGTD